MNHIVIPLKHKSINEGSSSLFVRGLIRWKMLTSAEKFVCISIILIPGWWVVGWTYGPLLLSVGLYSYQLARHKSLGLSRPSLSVVALLGSALYGGIIYKLNAPDAGPSGLIIPMQMWGAGGLLLWYVQSHRVRVRLQVVAWAFSVVVLQAVAFWLAVHFVLKEPHFTPPNTLTAIFLDKGGSYSSGKSGSVGNFLSPYNPDDKYFGGLVRYTFFFPHATISSFVFGFILLIALDLKNKIWTYSLIVSCSSLIILCQSRNAWVMLPLVVLVHWIATTGKTKGMAFLLALLAAGSLISLSVPQVTDVLTDKITSTAEATSNLRKASTDDRNKIYTRTWESITSEPPIVGHAVTGPPVKAGYDFARVGTESFVLGTLLYKFGFIGTGLFLTFFTSFLSWLYKTRAGRPSCCFLMLLLLGLMSTVTELTPTEVFTIMICVMVYSPEIKSIQNC